MSRDTKGGICFALLALLFGIVVLPFMIGREIYQYYKYLKPCNLDFEWEDIKLYGMIICIFSCFHWCWTDLSGLPTWMMF